MKKGVSLLFILILICMSCSATADGFCGELSLGESEDTMNIRFSLTRENQRFSFFSSLCPGWVFQAEDNLFMPAKLLWDTDEDLSRQMLQAWETWITVTGIETQSGLFAGDTFDFATEIKQLSFTWNDLAMLLDILDIQEWPESLAAEWARGVSSLRKILPGIAVLHSGIRFQLNLFEETGAMTLNVTDGTDTIGTFSARREADGTFLMVLGSAEAGKTYFRTFEITAGAGKQISVNMSALADDLGCGYSGLNEENLVLQEKLDVDFSIPESIPFRYSSMKGGTGEYLLSAEGSFYREINGTRNLEMQFYFGNDTQLLGSLRLTDDLSMTEKLPEDIRTLDCIHPDPETLEIVRQDIRDLSSEWMIQLFQVLPSEIVLLLLS